MRTPGPVGPMTAQNRQLLSREPGEIEMSLADRWLIVGTTGSGKTTATRELLRQLRGFYPGLNIYILDSKAVGDFDHMGGVMYTRDEPPDPLPSGAGQIFVWQPSRDDLDAYDDWLAKLLKSPDPFVLDIDELSSITTRGGDSPLNFQRLMKQGRGKRKSVVNCTQELAYIPRQVVTQTTHILRFQLLGEYDPRAGNRLVRRAARASEPPRFGFYYSRADKPEEAVLYRSYRDFFGL